MNLSLLVNHALWTTLIAGLISVAYSVLLTFNVLSKPRGDKKMNDIADAIQEGAAAYMKKQYSVVAIIGILIFVLLYFAFNPITAVGFAIGAVFSTIAGVVGMNIAVRSNIRTAQAAKKGLSSAFSLAFQGGEITGLMVGGLALLAVGGFYFLLSRSGASSLQPLVALGFGGSLISAAVMCSPTFASSPTVSPMCWPASGSSRATR